MKSILSDLKGPHGITVKKRIIHFKIYDNCFPGNELVDWLLLHKYSKTREDALFIGTKLFQHGFIENPSQGNF